MKIYIDFSVATSEGDAVGNVSGELDFSIVPIIGDNISFLFASNQVVLSRDFGFDGGLRVVDRVFRPNQKEDTVALILSDVNVKTREQALAIMTYFESGFNLFSNIY